MGRVLTDQKGESLPGEIVKIEVITPVWKGSGSNETSKYVDIPLEIDSEYQMSTALLIEGRRVRSEASGCIKIENFAGGPSYTRWRTSYAIYDSDMRIFETGSDVGGDQSAFYLRVFWNNAGSSAKIVVTYFKE